MKILLVDDEPMNLILLEEMLENEPFTLLKAEDGKEAIQLLETHDDIVIVVLDKMMPNIDGNEFIQITSQNEKWSKIPIIMQTAAAAKQDVIEGVHTSVYYYLTKPYQKEVMLSIFHAALEESKKNGLIPEDFKL
jgi:CheY-like chemotaxis protein